MIIRDTEAFLRQSTIYTLAPLTRWLVAACIATMPLWLVIAPYCGYMSNCVSSPSSVYYRPDIASLAFYVLSLGVIAFASTSRVLFRQGKIFFPRSYRGLPLQDLERVVFDQDYSPRTLIFQFRDSSGAEYVRQIPLDNCSKAALEKLLFELERKAPVAKVSLHVRDYVAALDRRPVVTSSEFELHYESRFLKRNMIRSFKAHGRTAVTTWCGLWGVLGVLALPLTYCMLSAFEWSNTNSSAMTYGGSWMSEQDNLLRNYAAWWEKGLDFCVGKPFNVVSDVSRNVEYAIPLMGLIAIVACSLFWWSLQSGPNRLIVNKKGILLGRRSRSGLETIQSLLWEDLSAITIHKPKGTTTPDRWQIHLFGRSSKAEMQLNFTGLGGNAEQQAFIRAIEQYAPSAAIDPFFLEQFNAAPTRSYTELWLQSLSSPPKRERLTPLEPGHSLQNGDFVIDSKLAVGGQGTAYLADRKKGGRIVLKEFVLPVYVDREIRKQALEKFQRESQLLKDLNHPKIVSLLDYFIEDHRAYLVLEHVGGVTLRKLVESGGPLSAAKVAALVDQMCEILEYLHGLQPPLVHRDFTPDNLILQDDGRLKLIDFDVARRSDSSARTSVVGKHSFIPPEQFRGKPTTQSDIYALGATAFFLLTGEDPEPLTKSVYSPLPEDEVSVTLAGIVQTATELDESERFKTAAELRSQLPGVSVKMNEKEFVDVAHS